MTLQQSRRGRTVLAVALGLLLGACTVSGPGPTAAHVSVGNRPIRPEIGAGAVWLAEAGDGTVARIDPTTNRVVARIRVGDPATLLAQGCAPSSEHAYATGSFGLRACDIPSAVSASDDLVWATKNDTGAVVAIDPRTNAVIATIPVGSNPWSVLARGTDVWVSDYDNDRVLRIDAHTRTVVATIVGLPHGPTEFAADAHAVWVVCSRAGVVVRIDARTNEPGAVIPVGAWPLGVALNGSDLWVRGGSTRTDGALSLIDTRTNQIVSTIAAGSPMGREGVSSLVAVIGGVWVPGVTLDYVDRAQLAVTRRIDLNSYAVNASGADLWVLNVVGELVRVRPVSTQEQRPMRIHDGAWSAARAGSGT